MNCEEKESLGLKLSEKILNEIINEQEKRYKEDHSPRPMHPNHPLNNPRNPKYTKIAANVHSTVPGFSEKYILMYTNFDNSYGPWPVYRIPVYKPISGQPNFMEKNRVFSAGSRGPHY